MPLSFAICSAATNPFFSQVVQGVCRRLEQEEDIRLLTWKGDHLIPPAALPYLSPDALILGALSSDQLNNLPPGPLTLGFSNAQQTFPWPRVVNDDRMVGELAANALIDAGYTRICLCGFFHGNHYQLRGKGVTALAKTRGIPCETLDTSIPPPAPGEDFQQVWDRRQIFLRTTLQALPKNTGLVVVDASVATELGHLLREEVKRPVPDEIGLVVADLVTAENIELSHVILPGEKVGQRCVETLLSGLRDPAYSIPPSQKIPPQDIAMGSTLRENEVQVLYQQLESWCHQHLRELVTVHQAATHLGLSRRSLEMKLHKHGLPSPYELLTSLRLQEVRTMLETTSWGMEEIAAATGFQTARALANRFRAHHRMSPKAWRDRQGKRAKPV